MTNATSADVLFSGFKPTRPLLTNLVLHMILYIQNVQSAGVDRLFPGLVPVLMEYKS